MWLARRHCAVQFAVSSVCGWRLDGGGTSDSDSSPEATLYLSGGVLGLLPRHAKSGGLPSLTSPPLFGLARSGASGRALSRPAPPKAGLIGRAVNLGCVRSVSSRCPTIAIRQSRRLHRRPRRRSRLGRLSRLDLGDQLLGVDAAT